MTKQARKRKLTDDEIDALVVAEVDDPAALDVRPVGDQFGQSNLAALTPDLRDKYFGGVNGLDNSSNTNFTFGSRRFRRYGVGRVNYLRGGTGTSCQEQHGHSCPNLVRPASHGRVSEIRRRKSKNGLLDFRINLP